MLNMNKKIKNQYTKESYLLKKKTVLKIFPKIEIFINLKVKPQNILNKILN